MTAYAAFSVNAFISDKFDLTGADIMQAIDTVRPPAGIAKEETERAEREHSEYVL